MPPDCEIILRNEDPDSPAALTCLAAYFEILIDKIDAITPADFPLPDPYSESYRTPHGAFLIAWANENPVGCVSLRPLEGKIAEVKRLWVAPAARGAGLARRLMTAIEDIARAQGYCSLKLDTNAALPEAIALYKATGWSETAPYTAFPATHWFVKPL